MAGLNGEFRLKVTDNVLDWMESLDLKWLKMYCAIIIICGMLIFIDFVDKLNKNLIYNVLTYIFKSFWIPEFKYSKNMFEWWNSMSRK